MNKVPTTFEIAQKDLDRFFEKIDFTETCWLWTAHTYHNGYGGFVMNGRSVKAHRFSYEIFVDDIPDGLSIDHVASRGCSNRRCVNPNHLEAVTQGENIRRGNSGRYTRATCRNGHEYTEGNTKMYRGIRHCIICSRAKYARANRRRK